LLGDSNTYKREKEQNLGVRVWLRFYSEKKVFRWEITGLFKLTIVKQPPLWARPLPSELEDPEHVIISSFLFNFKIFFEFKKVIILIKKKFFFLEKIYLCWSKN
jgi:hypothetical protein